MSLSVEEIAALIEQYEKETKARRNEILKLCWYMRGALSYEEGMLLSFNDREIISSIIKENMEITKESGLPFF